MFYHYNGQSVNTNIPREFASVQYSTIKEAIELIQKHGRDCYLAKSDIKSTFRIVPLHPSQYHLMGFTWEGKYYYDKCLAMGLSSFCQIFETVFILKTMYGIIDVVKVLDDFLFVEKRFQSCQSNLSSFLQLCELLGIPVAMEKTSDLLLQMLGFLGILLDTSK